MKKPLTVVFILSLASTLAFAQTGGSTDSKTGAGGSAKQDVVRNKPGDGSGIKSKSHKEGKKGGKKVSSAKPKKRSGSPPEPDTKPASTPVPK